MVYRTIKMITTNRQQFANFVKRVVKSIRKSKHVTYEGHDRGSRELYLSFKDEATADKILTNVEQVIKEHGYESFKREA